MDNDLYNSLQTIGTSQCVFDFKCKNNKDFQQSITKETSNFLKQSPMYKDYSFEFNISETGANRNNDLFLYMQAIMIDDYSDYNSKGELFVSTKNEKIIFAGSTCFKNCDDFLKIIYEIFEPKGLLAKKIEKKETTLSSDLTTQLKDLKQLLDDGVITEEEFIKAKKKLLD